MVQWLEHFAKKLEMRGQTSVVEVETRKQWQCSFTPLYTEMAFTHQHTQLFGTSSLFVMLLPVQIIHIAC